MIEKKLSSIGYREAPQELYDRVFNRRKERKRIILYHILLFLISFLFILSIYIFRDSFPYILQLFKVIFSIFKWKTFLPLSMVVLSLIPIWVSMEGIVLYYVLKK